MNMTNLDHLATLQKLDHEGMLGHAAALPQQCREAWAATQRLALPGDYRTANKVVIAGMGGSAIGGDLAAAVAAGTSFMPVLVHRDYELPAHVDAGTLLIASSYSGNTEETLAAFHAARERGCRLAAVTTGGELMRLAREWDAPLVSFDYESQPRAALGYPFMSVLGILRALEVLDDPTADLEEALAALEDRKGLFAPESPLGQNPAKQLASRLSGRVPIVIASGALAPVARRWKTQFNENSKSWAYFEVLPEMDHNALSGIHFPPEAAGRFRVILLQQASLHPRNALRLDLTQEILEGQGIGCERVLVPGGSELAQILSAVQLGDFASTYLALLYGADPTAIEDIVGLKEQMTDR
jgi:glucose/mannose-6-phosphate isomerase